MPPQMHTVNPLSQQRSPPSTVKQRTQKRENCVITMEPLTPAGLALMTLLASKEVMAQIGIGRMDLILIFLIGIQASQTIMVKKIVSKYMARDTITDGMTKIAVKGIIILSAIDIIQALITIT